MPAVCAPLIHVITVSEEETMTQDEEPMVTMHTLVEQPRARPCKVTRVPPYAGPNDGLTPSNVGVAI